MLSLPISAPVSTPAAMPALEHCWKCGNPTPSDGRVDPLYCAACARKHAVAMLQTAREVIVSLKRGRDVFTAMSCGDRDRLMVKLLEGIAEPIGTGPRAHSAHELDVQEFVGWQFAGPA